MGKFWRLDAICHTDHNDSCKMGYVETRNDATLDDVLKYIVKNHNTVKLYLEPLYSNLYEIGDSEDGAKMTVENIKKVINNDDRGYEIFIEEFCPTFIDC